VMGPVLKDLESQSDRILFKSFLQHLRTFVYELIITSMIPSSNFLYHYEFSFLFAIVVFDSAV
jgi:hypothetical protein